MRTQLSPGGEVRSGRRNFTDRRLLFATGGQAFLGIVAPGCRRATLSRNRGPGSRAGPGRRPPAWARRDNPLPALSVPLWFLPLVLHDLARPISITSLQSDGSAMGLFPGASGG